MRFHYVHGKNARITNNGLTASRPRALGEFNEAIVIANRALRDGEMFEVTIDKMVDRWSGAIEAGNPCNNIEAFGCSFHKSKFEYHKSVAAFLVLILGKSPRGYTYQTR